MALWKRKPVDRKTLENQLGKELVEWGDKIADLYEMPEYDERARPDDIPNILPTTAVKAPPMPTKEEKRHYAAGVLMVCIVCGNEGTVDGRYCRTHSQ